MMDDVTQPGPWRWAVFEAKQGYVDRARSLLVKGCKLNPKDPPLLQALARLEAVEGNMQAGPYTSLHLLAAP